MIVPGQECKGRSAGDFMLQDAPPLGEATTLSLCGSERHELELRR